MDLRFNKKEEQVTLVSNHEDIMSYVDINEYFFSNLLSIENVEDNNIIHIKAYVIKATESFQVTSTPEAIKELIPRIGKMVSDHAKRDSGIQGVPGSAVPGSGHKKRIR